MLRPWVPRSEKRTPIPPLGSPWGSKARSLLISALGVLAWTSSARADLGPVGASFENGAASSADGAIDHRREEVLRSGACGDEYPFLLRAQLSETSEDQTTRVLAKLGFLIKFRGNSDIPCHGVDIVSNDDGFTDIFKNQDEKSWYYYTTHDWLAERESAWSMLHLSGGSREPRGKLAHRVIPRGYLARGAFARLARLGTRLAIEATPTPLGAPASIHTAFTRTRRDPILSRKGRGRDEPHADGERRGRRTDKPHRNRVF